jgi:HKD family nuclease
VAATTQIVSTLPPERDLLPALRQLLADGDEALLCVAFVNRKGVSLVEDELRGVAGRGGCRILLTSVFGATEPAVQRLTKSGVTIKVLNWRGGTYHPKLYLSRSDADMRVLLGSANLTSGILRNVETAVSLRGPQDWDPVARAWEIAEDLWSNRDARDWQPADVGQTEGLTRGLEGLLRTHLPATVSTLSSGAPNRIDRITAEGVYVNTRRSGARAELVEGWMLDLAWDELCATGRLTNKWLLTEAHVHRSSFICAALAQLPGVEVVSHHPIELRLHP